MSETAPAPKQIDCGGGSVRGTRNEYNSDRFLIGHLSRSMLVPESNTTFGSRARLFGHAQGHLLLVADGLDRGDGLPAAEAATETLAQQFLEAIPWPTRLDGGRETQVAAELETAVRRCHSSIMEQAGRERDLACFGTTLTAAYILWPRLHLIHLGNSRCYLIRKAQSRQLTNDHVRHVSTAGSSTSGEGENRRPEHGTGIKMLTNALGAGIHIPTVDFVTEELAIGDKLVLCTAGLVHVVDEDRMLRRVDRARTAAEASESLIALAQEQDATDDATVVVARFTRLNDRRNLES